MTLGWREHLCFDLAYVGSQRLAETTWPSGWAAVDTG